VTDQSPDNPGITPLPPIALVARVRGLAPERLFPLHGLAACGSAGADLRPAGVIRNVQVFPAYVPFGPLRHEA
jgi:hypothetical protein